jgi:sorbitol-specific phosphotransferase system component IIBC
MLKPAEPTPGAVPERPVGELVHQLVEDGKSYVQAEIALAKAMATEKVSSLVMPVALFGAAFVFVLAAITALALGVVMALAKFIGPLAAGFAGLLIFAGIAGLLAWIAVGKLKRSQNGR